MSPGPSVASGRSKLLDHVFVDADFKADKCCGYIGKSAFFCLRDKAPGYLSCQTLSHAERRFIPAVDCFYAPIGLYYNTPAANSEKGVNINELSGAQQERFMGARYSRAGWERVFDDVLSNGRVSRSEPSVMVPPAVVNMPSRVEDQLLDQGSLPYLSTSGSVDSRALTFEAETGMLERGVEEERKDTQEDVHGAILQLREDTARGFKELHENMRHVIADETGDLSYLLERHGSIANFVEIAAAEPIRLMENSLLKSMEELERRVAQNQSGTGLIKLFRQLVDQVNRRYRESDERLRMLEQHVNREAGRLPSRLELNESEEMVDIAGHQVPVSMVFWIQKIREMESRVDVLNARAKNGGVSVGDYTFASLTELQALWMLHDPAGVGMAACVDIVSLIQGFGSSESVSTQEFLSTSEKAKKVNLRPGEGGFAASFKNRHLDCFAGKASSTRIPSSVTLQIFKDWDDWKGNGHAGDGYKDTITRMIEQACANHRQYLDDAGLPDELRNLALTTAKLSQSWWMDLASYLDNEFLMLESYKLGAKQILLLLSNQMVQIFEDLAEKRVPAGNTEIANRPKATVRYAWATLQAHSVMAAYREAKFRDHQAIAGTFIRFLTRNLADQSSLGLGSLVQSLQNEVKALKKELDKKLNTETYNKFETKVTKALPKAGGAKE